MTVMYHDGNRALQDQFDCIYFLRVFYYRSSIIFLYPYVICVLHASDFYKIKDFLFFKYLTKKYR